LAVVAEVILALLDKMHQHLNPLDGLEEKVALLAEAAQ
jgi:hypothetical protein